MTATALRSDVRGFEAIVLENRHLRAAVIPSLGGRVWELEDRARSRQWIWHRPDVPLRACRPGEPYDEVWAGGWEELFPNDAPGLFEGRWLPDHGEWWTLDWTVAQVSSGGDDARLRLTAASSVVRATCTKEIVLAADAPMLSIDYAIQSEEPRAFHFLFKQHLPIAVTPRCRLVLPGGVARAVDPGFGTMAGTADPFAWPIATPGSGADLRVVPDAVAAAREFLYVSELADGWCGVVDHEAGASLRLAFDRRDFPFAWLFLSYGGWRGTYTAVLEPCTNMPKDLGEAVRTGRAACLGPGATFRTRVTVTLGDLAALPS